MGNITIATIIADNSWTVIMVKQHRWGHHGKIMKYLGDTSIIGTYFALMEYIVPLARQKAAVKSMIKTNVLTVKIIHY